MSDLENSAKSFLQRWSRLKRAAATCALDGAQLQRWKNESADASAEPRSETVLPTCDPATLPPIESITITSDIRAFLAPGVPEELTRAALRRLWVTDPTIRDFVGLAENQWDFTKPDGVPGFGSLEQLTPELRRMVAGLFSDASDSTAHPRPTDVTSGEQIIGRPTELPAPTPAATAERDAAKEHLQRESELVVSHGVAPDEVNPPHINRNHDFAVHENFGQSGESRRLSPRKHGGAVPKCDDALTK